MTPDSLSGLQKPRDAKLIWKDVIHILSWLQDLDVTGVNKVFTDQSQGIF